MDHEGIARLAALAKLDISEAERDQFAAQLTDILRYVDQLQAVDTSAIADTSHPLPQMGALREDVPGASLDRAAGLANAPDADHDAGLFRVPKVIG
ncbi:MAG: Asp-tRNA(Asn)/Glu-tRNA(Gln) amidotransferase subunit GatC [Acidobacteria bacterium]|nr:Asp-tRNA(Asn)/Glu-tRNA(Gln) amidotransferase subunit GatC [Acidobacteriota bacterium]